MRALTHRAVDQAASLPPGTASHHFATRQDLARALLEEIATTSRYRIDGEGSLPPAAAVRTEVERLAVVEQMTAVCAAFTKGLLTDGRSLTLDRYACGGEVATQPELTEILHAADQFHPLAAQACRALGAAQLQLAGDHLLALLDDLVHDRLLGAGSLSPEPPDDHSSAAASAIRANLLGSAGPPPDSTAQVLPVADLVRIWLRAHARSRPVATIRLPLRCGRAAPRNPCAPRTGPWVGGHSTAGSPAR